MKSFRKHLNEKLEDPDFKEGYEKERFLVKMKLASSPAIPEEDLESTDEIECLRKIKSQSYFWTKDWQKHEKESEENKENNKLNSFSEIDNALDWLDK